MPNLRAAAASVSLGDDNLETLGPGEPLFPDGHEGQFRVSAVLIEADETVGLVSCDALTVPAALATRVSERLAATTHLPRSHLLFTASHTHHGPGTLDVLGLRAVPEFLRRLEEAAYRALQAAWQQLRDSEAPPNRYQAELLFAVGQEATVGRNSRLLLQDGQIGWYGYEAADVVRPTGPYDPDLLVLTLRAMDGRTIATLFNHSVHNIGTLQAGRPSPGFYGLAAQELERRHGGVCLFLPGALGSTHNCTYEGSGLAGQELVDRVVAAVEEALGRAEPALIGPVAALQRPFTYRVRAFDEAAEAAAVRRYFARYATADAAAQEAVFAAERAALAPHQGQTRQTTLQVVRLGQVALVGIPGELFARLGLAIRRGSPLRHTFVVGLANDDFGYVPDAEGYDLGGYQAWVHRHCPAERGTGEAMVAQALSLVEEVAGLPAVVDPPRLRDLRADDALALQAFYNRTSTDVRWLFCPLGWNASLGACQDICNQVGAGNRYDVVLDNGCEIVGWAFVSGLETGRAYLGIGITDRYCSQGLGKPLMQAVMDKCRELGQEAVELIVIQDNARAQRLYERFGFVRTGEFVASSGQAFYRMVAELGERQDD